MCVNRGYLANCYAEKMAKLQQNCRWILQIYWQYLSYVALWVTWICIKQRTLCTQVLQIPTFIYCDRLSVMLCVLVCIQIIQGLIWNKWQLVIKPSIVNELKVLVAEIFIQLWFCRTFCSILLTLFLQDFLFLLFSSWWTVGVLILVLF
jgi:hypothetical protein